MESYKEQRFLVPGAVLVLMFIATWLCAGGDVPSSFWSVVDKDLPALVAALVGLLVTTYAGGALCASFAVFAMRWLLTMGIEQQAFLVNNQNANKKPRRREIKAELHYRFHTGAGEQLVAFASRRLNMVYMSLNSAFALLIGAALGLYTAWRQTSLNHINGAHFLDTCLVLGICLALLVACIVNACIARYEHWDVFTRFCKDNPVAPVAAQGKCCPNV